MPRLSKMTVRVLILAGALTLLGRPACAASPPRTGTGAALAVEDTMHTEVPEVLVRAPRVTLSEILDRVAAGEARRDSLLQDQSYLLTVRTVGHAADGKQPRLVEESVSRVWQRKPDQTRSMELRHWYAKPPKDKDPKPTVEVESGDGMGEDIVNFAFQPSARREFKYHIAGREILGDHVIYRIAFEPRSGLDVYKPCGEVWVDTRDYVILRQEISFRQSPVPLFLRSLDRLVVERQQVGDFWVLARLLARLRTTIPLPKYGSSFDLAVQFTDYTVNTGLPDSIFAKPQKGKKKQAEASR